MALTWVACEARSGRVIDFLPDLVVPKVGVRIGAMTTTTATLPLDGAPADWERATKPGATFLVQIDDAGDGTPPVPTWGGLVSIREKTESDEIALSVKTLEAYLDGRYVADRTFAAVGQNVMIESLVSEFAPDLPIRVVYDGPGMLRDRTYKDAADMTLLSAMTNLSAVIGGPEWVIGWERQSDPERYTPVLHVGGTLGAAQVGVRTPVGLHPAAVFEMPGSVTSLSMVEDYTSGKGATDVMAVSSASADIRPQSPHQVAPDSDRLPVEYRFTPWTSITEVSTLTDHASARLAVMKDGAVSLSMTATVEDAPRVGRDWSAGDDIAVLVRGQEDDPALTAAFDLYSAVYTETYGVEGVVRMNLAGKPTVPAFPRGLYVVARAVGWDMTLGSVPTITPVLVADTWSA